MVAIKVNSTTYLEEMVESLETNVEVEVEV